MREHKYAIAKDLSKFYNCVLADPVAQHTRRVVWRDGDPEAVPKVYCTTTVNFGDKPAGCIAIAAIKLISLAAIAKPPISQMVALNSKRLT